MLKHTGEFQNSLDQTVFLFKHHYNDINEFHALLQVKFYVRRSCFYSAKFCNAVKFLTDPHFILGGIKIIYCMSKVYPQYE